MSQDPDLKAFFEDGFCEEYWGPGLTEEASGQEAEQVVRLLGADRGHILDWRGGRRRHAIHFAEASPCLSTPRRSFSSPTHENGPFGPGPARESGMRGTHVVGTSTPQATQRKHHDPD